MRGGHQVSWLIDGVQIPNTNIASNLGAQIDPKDIDYLEVQRGSYTADIGDRTYGVFNVVPRTGFERNRQAELVPLRRQLPPDQRPAQLRRPHRKVRLVRQPQRQPQRLRPRPAHRPGHPRRRPTASAASPPSSTTARRKISSAWSHSHATISSRSPTTPTPPISRTSSSTPAASATASTRPTASRPSPGSTPSTPPPSCRSHPSSTTTAPTTSPTPTTPP